MRRKYNECVRQDGDCTACALVSYGRDCRNRPITKLEWARRAAGLSQSELAEKAGVHWKQIQKVELGQNDAGNMAARNILAIAEVLGVEVKDLI